MQSQSWQENWLKSLDLKGLRVKSKKQGTYEKKKAQLVAAPSFLNLYLKNSIFEGANGTGFMTLYLDRNHRVAGNWALYGA